MGNSGDFCHIDIGQASFCVSLFSLQEENEFLKPYFIIGVTVSRKERKTKEML